MSSTQYYDLSLVPESSIVRVHASQWDNGERKFIFTLYDENGLYTIPSGATIELRATKADGHAYIMTSLDTNTSVAYSGNTVTITTDRQMCAVEGEQDFKINIKIGSKNVASARYTLVIDADTVNDETDISDSVIPSIIALATEQMEAAARSAEAAATSEQNAAISESNAANSAQAAATSESNAATSEQNAATSEQNAEASADRAEAYSVNVPYIGANGNWWIWNTTTGAYVDSGVDASITVDIADITMLEPTETPYVTNSGTNTDPIFHFFIPRGKGIASITKTNVSGLVDTYTITYSDGLTTTFTVTNGKTAYQSAVEGGYRDTEEQFEADLAHFEEWKDDAETAAHTATSEATSARQDALDAKAQADRAQMYADFLEPHFLIANNRLYIKDDAVGQFILVNNRLYMKFVG